MDGGLALGVGIGWGWGWGLGGGGGGDWVRLGVGVWNWVSFGSGMRPAHPANDASLIENTIEASQRKAARPAYMSGAFPYLEAMSLNGNWRAPAVMAMRADISAP